MPRVTKTTKTRHFSYSKKYPKGAKAIFKIERGNCEQIISLHFPKNVECKNIEVPKTKNPYLFTLHLSNLKICCYVKDKNPKKPLSGKYDFDKGFIYDSDGNYCASFFIHDLTNLFVEIGAFLKQIKRPIG